MNGQLQQIGLELDAGAVVLLSMESGLLFYHGDPAQAAALDSFIQSVREEGRDDALDLIHLSLHFQRLEDGKIEALIHRTLAVPYGEPSKFERCREGKLLESIEAEANGATYTMTADLNMAVELHSGPHALSFAGQAWCPLFGGPPLLLTSETQADGAVLQLLVSGSLVPKYAGLKREPEVLDQDRVLQIERQFLRQQLPAAVGKPMGRIYLFNDSVVNQSNPPKEDVSYIDRGLFNPPTDGKPLVKLPPNGVDRWEPLEGFDVTEVLTSLGLNAEKGAQAVYFRRAKVLYLFAPQETHRIVEAMMRESFAPIHQWRVWLEHKGKRPSDGGESISRRSMLVRSRFKASSGPAIPEKDSYRFEAELFGDPGRGLSWLGVALRKAPVDGEEWTLKTNAICGGPEARRVFLVGGTAADDGETQREWSVHTELPISPQWPREEWRAKWLAEIEAALAKRE